ncbi:MAG: STAS domain-containing protein [Chloroflexaceae bacterium]|nr:STAS domain-containing protein [Chloroflexaceae bacterium]
MRAPDGTILGVVGIYEDITERVLAEQAEALERQRIIEEQAATLEQVSTPLIPIAEGLVALPLVGSIDGQRAQQVMETLLEGIAHYRASIAIIDITGVQTVDTQVAQALVQAAQAVRLLGAQVVLTGIQPPIAQTMVHLGVDLQGIVTRSTLQSGIAYALEQGNIHIFRGMYTS